jgi:hypothetical protein
VRSGAEAALVLVRVPLRPSFVRGPGKRGAMPEPLLAGCWKCRKEVPPDARFCPSCAAPLSGRKGPTAHIAPAVMRGAVRTASTGVAASVARLLRRRVSPTWLILAAVQVLGLAVLGILVAVFPPGRISGPSNEQAAEAARGFPDREAEKQVPPPPREVAPPVPTPDPEQLVLQDRQEFLAGVDESISGARIAGNPYKFVGTRVDLHGTVGKIVDRNVFNFASSDANLAVVGDASDLEAGQWIRVVGVVAPPQEGVNLFGGVTNFPTVVSKWIEIGRAARQRPRSLAPRTHACPGPECASGFGPTL